MRILSLPAISALARRLVYQAGGALSYDDLIGQLVRLEVSTERAEAGVRLAVMGERLHEAEPADLEADGAPVVLVLPPVPVKEAA